MRCERIALDALMSMLLVLQMLYLILSELWHEVAGCLLIVLFAVHHFMNRRWYKTMGKGKYNTLRITMYAIDALSLFSIITLAISGIMLSQHVFVFLNIKEGMDSARILHLAASYWGFFLISLHAGMHMTGVLKKNAGVYRFCSNLDIWQCLFRSRENTVIHVSQHTVRVFRLRCCGSCICPSIRINHGALYGVRCTAESIPKKKSIRGNTYG